MTAEVPGRPVSAATLARMTRFPLCGADVAVLDGDAGLQLVALWQGAGDAVPRIVANRFVDAGTVAELRAIADWLEAASPGPAPQPDEISGLQVAHV